MRRSLKHFWRLNLAVVLSCAVASAVLTGALLVGDSVRGSLEDLTLERLGAIDFALVGSSYFRQALDEDLRVELGGEPGSTAAAILVQGSAVHSRSGARASRVRVQGVDATFATFFDDAALSFEAGASQNFPSLILNAALQRELGAAVGDDVLLAMERPGDAPRETLMSSSDTEEVVRELRLTVTSVLPDLGIGRFSLRPSQELPLLAFVDLETLQGAIERDGLVNTLLVAASEKGDAEARLDVLQQSLRSSLALEDLGLEIAEGEGWVELQSRDYVLSPALETVVDEFAETIGARRFSVLTYIANRLTLGDRSVPYSSITALRTDVEAPFGPLSLVDGSSAPELADDELLVNEWVADDLGARVGDTIELTYFEVGPRETLTTRQASFRLRGVVALEGLGADRRLTPEFPGIHDADDMRDWDSPFPMDLSTIRDKDEAYWDAYRATPKAFFSQALGRRLWSTRFGKATSIRLASEDVTPAELAVDVSERFPSSFDPQRLGFSFEAVKARGLEASSGSTDFRMLFLAFSIFLIASAALLVALFFGLGVEQRASEMGLLLAVGLPMKKVRRRFLVEGAFLTVVGVLLGLVGAVVYAGLMMAALRSWWQAAVGTSVLFLHVQPLSLVIGAAIAFVVAFLSILGALRRMRRVPAVSLLRGVVSTGGSPLRHRRVKWTLVLSSVFGAGTLIAALVLGKASSPAFFFTVGACLLVAGLSFLALKLAKPADDLLPRPSRNLLPMAARNASLNPGRSLLSACLVASASFVIVAVAANGFRYGEEVGELDSPAGGYTLVAESDIPLHSDLESSDTLFDLGLSQEAASLLQQTTVTPFRVLPGDDVSCLNLYQPESPRILGVPPEQAARGGFQFQQTADERPDPWSLLGDDLGEVVPAFGDHESVLWILKLGLGKDLVVENERGEPVTLRFVGLLRKGIFQSEVLISEENFKRHFPSRTGYSYFLLDPPAERSEEISELLEASFGPYGFDVTPTTERLQRFQAVFNTYLATFQTLGGLGLLLGTLGLAAVLLRNVMERRGELATLRALGFRRRSLGWLVVAENGFLLILGVLIGCVAAFVAVAPHLLEGSALVPWGSLTLTLVAILAVGTLACVAAVRSALATPLLPALKSE